MCWRQKLDKKNPAASALGLNVAITCNRRRIKVYTHIKNLSSGAEGAIINTSTAIAFIRYLFIL